MKKIYRMMSKKELLKEVLMECKTAAERKGLLTGVPTWFYDLDYMTRGLQKGDLVLISGHALSGKKALALSIARNVAIKEKKTVAYFSLGVSGIQVMNRLVSMDSEVKLLNILSGRIDKYGWDCLKTSAERIAGSMMYVFDNPCSTLDRIRNICVKVKKNKGLDLIVVDYHYRTIHINRKLF